MNAYAFGTMGVLAGIAAIVAFAGAALLLLAGLWHSRRATSSMPPFTMVEPKTPAVV